MAMFRTVREFVEKNCDWLEYVEHFFAANEITDEDKKRSILLSYLVSMEQRLTSS